MTTAYRAEIEAIAAQFHLDPDLVEAIVLAESNGQTHAYRFEPGFWQRYMKDKQKWDGANPERVASSYGLMQCMYPVAVEYGYSENAPEYLFVPTIGLFWGCTILRSLLDWSRQNVDQALAAYNGGKNGNTSAPYRNQHYIDKVKWHLERVMAEEGEHST